MADFKVIPPPERRRPPDYYSADELHEILVDDGVKRRPLGGSSVARLPGSKMSGLQWMTEAIAKIAAVRKIDAETAFANVVLDIEARTGHPWVAVG